MGTCGHALEEGVAHRRCVTPPLRSLVRAVAAEKGTPTAQPLWDYGSSASLSFSSKGTYGGELRDGVASEKPVCAQACRQFSPACRNVLPLQLTSRGFLGRRAEQASELLRSQRTSQRLIARSQSTGGTGTCSARKSAQMDSIRQYCRHLRGGLSILLLVKNRISFGPSHTLSLG